MKRKTKRETTCDITLNELRNRTFETKCESNYLTNAQNETRNKRQQGNVHLECETKTINETKCDTNDEITMRHESTKWNAGNQRVSDGGWTSKLHEIWNSKWSTTRKETQQRHANLKCETKTRNETECETNCESEMNIETDVEMRNENRKRNGLQNTNRYQDQNRNRN